MGSNEFRLFTKMRVKTANYRILTGFTMAGFVFKTVATAFSRTKRTGFEYIGLSFHLVDGHRLYDSSISVK